MKQVIVIDLEFLLKACMKSERRVILYEVTGTGLNEFYPYINVIFVILLIQFIKAVTNII